MKTVSLPVMSTPEPAMSFFSDTTPKPGDVTEVRPGVFWLRMALPMAGLDHINLYFLKDGDGFTVIDTGLGWHEAKQVWNQVFEKQMNGAQVKKVICTHLHPDHAGLAGWICRKFDAPLLMSRAEYFLCRVLAADTGKPAPREGIRFYTRAGLNDEQIENYKSRFGGFGKAISPMPDGYFRLKDGDTVMIDGRDWQVIIGTGHSPEHVCLFNPELNLVLSGDQILPSISSNVGVWPTEPEANPVEDWIASCERFIKALPKDVLVLPAHGIPFVGAHARLKKLIHHHERSLSRLLAFCQTPRGVIETFPILFKRKIGDGTRLMAVGEAIGHLNCLMQRGQMRRSLNEKGQYLYQSIKTGQTG